MSQYDPFLWLRIEPSTVPLLLYFSLHVHSNHCQQDFSEFGFSFLCKFQGKKSELLPHSKHTTGLTSAYVLPLWLNGEGHLPEKSLLGQKQFRPNNGFEVVLVRFSLFLRLYAILFGFQLIEGRSGGQYLVNISFFLLVLTREEFRYQYLIE